ncbi:hypothetical protein LTR70_006516 [Exophiala xenobiotica]|uniref:Putative transcription factor kapC n=1 Tax=Lithohypha guttulata TaxID=1690604 RepID=A0ABR0K103_9EURO|nr:hypothetical protein LTR24_008040 [Lithohypha guttulata]KAK5315964.1 hypothetical protein LTR70_006516 [Exophiala xenobiotica]
MSASLDTSVVTDLAKHVNQMTFDDSIPYEIYDYSATPVNFYPAQTSNKIHAEFTSSALDEKDRRRKRSDASKSGAEKATIPNTHMRRRAQNRASQRAFRERKEKHVKGLEHQLEELHEKHQDLLQSYTKQADEVSRLNSRIAELSTELTTMRQCQDSSFSDLITSDKFDKFDAFSSTNTVIYNTSDTYYDKGPFDLNSEFALHSFEGSL